MKTRTSLWGTALLLAANSTLALAQVAPGITLPPPATQARRLAPSPTVTFPPAPAAISGTCNMVANADFEIQTPPLSGQLSNVGHFDPVSQTTVAGEVPYWYSPNYGTPDYFATNSPAGPQYPTNPANAMFGPFSVYQPTPTSQHRGSAGLYTLYTDGSVPGANGYREVIAQQIPALSGTKWYCALMKVYRAGYAQFATGIGMDITPGSPVDPTNPSGDPGLPLVISGCGFHSSPIMSSTWQEVGGIFPGIAGANLLRIGNFETVPAQQTAGTPGGAGIGYLYIDAVRLYEIPEAGPNVTVSCGGEVSLGTGCTMSGMPFTYRWVNVANPSQTLATTSTLIVKANRTETYELTVTVTTGTTTSTRVTRVTVTPAYPAGCTVCPPVAPQLSTAGPQPCPANEQSFTVTNFDPQLTYEVHSFGMTPLPRYFGYGYANNGSFRIKGNGSGPSSGQFYVTASNSCGTTPAPDPEYYIDVQTPGCDGPIAVYGKAYPNPAEDNLTLPADVTAVQLVDAYGKVIPATRFQRGTLDVRHVPAGLYHVRMTRRDGSIKTQQVQVVH